MATLLEDIGTYSDWIVKAFKADNLHLDYTLESFRMIDEFFDLYSEKGEAKPNGRLSRDRGVILFAIGAYVGETIRRNVPGSKWMTKDSDPEGEINVEVELPQGATIWPVQRVIGRFQNGPEDGIYAYGAVVIKGV
jgi:hypothetical protein